MKMIDEYISKFTQTGNEVFLLKSLLICRNENLNHLGITLGEYFCNIFPFSWRVAFETALLYLQANLHRKTYELFNRVLEANPPSEIVTEILETRRKCIPYIENDYNYYDPKIVKKIQRRTPRHLPLVTLTMTSCKRYKLFEQTVNTFLNCCTDLHLIDRWICIDDNSSEEDREKMKKNYPFFEFIFKGKSDKGHPRSMNIIREKIQTPYYFHLEDDWKFFSKKDYISHCMRVLCENDNLGQCLLNKNYSETAQDNIVGGITKFTSSGFRYVEHEFCHTDQQKRDFVEKWGDKPNCSYWPHFSFRPGLNRSNVHLTVGRYNEKTPHFEMEYSYRAYNAGFRTVFLEETNCLHIGRLTSEMNDPEKINAYKLNNETQFHEKDVKRKETKQQKRSLRFKVFVINLDCRPDRMEKFKQQKIELPYERFPAVNGYKLVSTPQLQRIFDGNDYNMRKGMVGCALSHIQLCVNLANSPEQDMYLILEDDVTFVPDFRKKFVHAISQLPPDWDILYLGHHLHPQFKNPKFYDKESLPIVEQWNRLKSLQISMGGTGGYIISRKGAYRFLEFINRTGMTNGIDTVQQKSADELGVFYCTPHLIYSECWIDSDKPDTDIQNNYDSLTVPIQTRFEQELEFYGIDSEIYIPISEENVIEYMKNPDNRVLFYQNPNQNTVYNLQKECKLPCYTLNDQVLVIVPKPNQRHLRERYFDRLKKCGEFSVDDCLIYKDDTK